MHSRSAAKEDSEPSVKKLKSYRSTLPLLQPEDYPSTSSASANHPPELQVPESTSSKKPPIDIFAKLAELYESEKETPCSSTGLRYNTLLLEKLVANERLNTLVVNLYPGNKGYSLAFRTEPRSAEQDCVDDTAKMIETNEWPYEEGELLRYIENEELPPFIVDLLEPKYSHLFYSGCIIAEIRDYRPAYPLIICDIHHVLLRPTLKNIIADINNMVEDKPEWTSDEKDQLESQILIASQPFLCLDPDTSIFSEVAEINNQNNAFNTRTFHRMAKKHSQTTVNRKRKLDQFTYRDGLDLYEFITKPKTKSRLARLTRKSSEEQLKLKPVPVPNLDARIISPPSQPVVIKEFKTYQRPKETSDCSPQLIEEYVLETDMPSKEKGKPRIYHIKLSILQRPSNSEYLGELYLDRDHKKDEQNGVACRFSLGSRANATRYIHQFTEIFTESGRKSARICYEPGPGYKVMMAQHQAQQQAQQQQQQQQQQQLPHVAQQQQANTMTNQQSIVVKQQHPNLAQQHINQLSQTLQQQVSQPIVNGSVVGLSSQSMPVLQSHLQGISKQRIQLNDEQAIKNALAVKLMISAEQFQAENASQQQKLSASVSNPAIRNLLNSSPASNVNNDAFVNAINSSPLLSQQQQQQQIQAIGQKLLHRKMTLPSNTRVLNHHGNLIALNNNRVQELQQQQQQTITLTSLNPSNYTNITLPTKQQRILNATPTESGGTVLSALLVGTPAANRPDIIAPSTNSLLLEKFKKIGETSQQQESVRTIGGAQQQQQRFIQSPKTSGQQQQHHYVLQQSPKSATTTVLSPLSSPPGQTANTINVQNLNFAQLQNIPGLQNMQFQVPGFAQPLSLSLNVSSAGMGAVQGNHQGTTVIVSLPTTHTSNASSASQAAAALGSSSGHSGTLQTVVLNAGTSNLAPLVSSGMKAIPQQALRTTASPQTVSITQGGQPLQLLTPLPRARLQPGTVQQQPQQVRTATIQRSTPITIKMAAPTNANQLQKPNQYQQLCLNQAGASLVTRRRSNASDQQ